MTKHNRAPLIEAYETMNNDPDKPHFELEKQMYWATTRLLVVVFLLTAGILLAVWGAKKIHDAQNKEVTGGGIIHGAGVYRGNVRDRGSKPDQRQYGD